jgi:cytoskeletal protein CcmA (bactofilin family)
MEWAMKVSMARGVPSVIGPDLKMEGKIVTEGDVLILGTLTGIVCARTLTVGKGGMIDGHVEAETVVIDGSLSGSLTATSVLLGRTASVYADMTYVSMEMQSGAILSGTSRHVDCIKAAATNEQTPTSQLEFIHSAHGTA